MPTVNLADAQARLQEILAGLNPGEQVIITKDGEPFATLTRSGPAQWPCKAGSAKDKLLWIAPEFDAPLEEFPEYME